ncbi:hypothetical protein CALCODRAFT_379009 [Calocera cornea HHB12733]|uniref:Uncharacterized protein n=1 Tax=Calocera cornea HHB12733 TaxID=1353952 RepID=A0A165EDJ0_9BASI|nr:hypothetical protein CALCODRAFT_379009 [Calocera cornea HHB12733]
MTAVSSVQAYNITIGEQSAVYAYNPHRDIDLASGWNDSYTGSSNFVLGAVGSGTPYRATQYNGASVALTFQGMAVYVCFTASDGVDWDLTLIPTATTRQVDGSSDPICSTWGGNTLVVADSLSYDNYNATLTFNTIPSGADVFFYGSVVGVSVGPTGVQAEPAIVVDDHASTWTYVPSDQWVQETDDGAIDGGYTQTCSYNQSDIASATYTASSTYLGSVDTSLNFAQMRLPCTWWACFGQTLPFIPFK